MSLAGPKPASARSACAAHLGAPKQAEARRLDAEQDVLGHREVRAERQLLVDHRDARAPRVAVGLAGGTAAVEQELARVGA